MNTNIKNTLDEIPDPDSYAKKITGLVKDGNEITGYQLSDNSIISKEEGINMAKQGQIQGVGIAHKGDTVYLKSIPNRTDKDNLSHLPTVE